MGVLDVDVDFRAIEGAVTGIDFVISPIRLKGGLQAVGGQFPLVIRADGFFRPGGQFQMKAQAEGAVNSIHQFQYAENLHPGSGPAS